MTPEQAKHGAEILLAYARGEKVQGRSLDRVNGSYPDWIDLGDEWIDLKLSSGEYRLKPQPREIWVDADSLEGSHIDGYPCPQSIGKQIKFREVLE